MLGCKKKEKKKRTLLLLGSTYSRGIGPMLQKTWE
jgi:hypothetical protein